MSDVSSQHDPPLRCSEESIRLGRFFRKEESLQNATQIALDCFAEWFCSQKTSKQVDLLDVDVS